MGQLRGEAPFQVTDNDLSGADGFATRDRATGPVHGKHAVSLPKRNYRLQVIVYIIACDQILGPRAPSD